MKLPIRPSHRAREMLVLTVEAGYCVCRIPAPYYAVWAVRGRGGSVDFEFSDRTGRSLLSLGLIELLPGEIPPRPRRSLKAPLAVVRYMPTAVAVAMVAKIMGSAAA
jgi:hypothetical protein